MSIVTCQSCDMCIDSDDGNDAYMISLPDKYPVLREIRLQYAMCNRCHDRVIELHEAIICNR